MPLDPKIVSLSDTPHTISFVIRKRQQIDNLNELPKDKRPTDDIIWDGTPEEMDEWIEKVFSKKYKESVDIDIADIEA